MGLECIGGSLLSALPQPDGHALLANMWPKMEMPFVALDRVMDL